MADQPFNRTPLYPLEKPLADDINQGFSQADRSLRHVMYELLAGSSGFIRGSFQVVPSTPAALSVVMKAGLGFQDAPTDTPSAINNVVGLEDLARYKPLQLSNDLTIAVPAPPGSNSRIDLIEVRYNRQLDNAQSRNFLNTSTNQFSPASVSKTLDFNLDAALAYWNATDVPTSAIAYKSGVTAVSPSPPATDTGYMAVAYITVATGAVTIVAANIQDERNVIGLSGAYLGRQIITANGTYTPLGGTKARLRMVGGGGGGGGVAGGATSVAASGGGASGQYLEHYITGISPLTGGAVSIGTAGGGGAAGNNAGTAGGDTSVVINGTTYTAKGGGAASGSANHDTFGQNGGSIPTGSTATDITAGANGGPGVGVNSAALTTSWCFGGNGGSNPLGMGGFGGSNANGGAGRGYGAGGGGSSNSVATTNAGGSGTAGVVIIEEWL